MRSTVTSPIYPYDTHENDDSKDRYITSGKHICLDTMLFFKNISSIEAAYKEAENFHNLGGNLKILEMYLNNQIDETLNIQDLGFYSFDNNDGTIPPNMTVTAWWKQLQKRNDLGNSGGYLQRWPPGMILPRGTYVATEIKDWFVDMPKNFNKKSDRLRTMRTLRGTNKRNQKFDVMEPIEGFQRWKTGIGQIFDICKNVDRIGDGKKYEGKFMCSFDTLAKTKSSSSIVDEEKVFDDRNQQIDSNCNIMSIGNNGEWGFENTINEQTTCSTHTFDCTVADPKKPEKDSIHFYHYCIADKHKKNGEREYLPYSQMLQIAGLSSAPTLFKMDVEGFEYDVLTQIIVDAAKTGSTSKLPSQISVELHYATRMYDLPWLLRLRQAGEIAMLTGLMYRVGGYLPVNVQYFEDCEACAEVLFVRVFCDQ